MNDEIPFTVEDWRIAVIMGNWPMAKEAIQLLYRIAIKKEFRAEKEAEEWCKKNAALVKATKWESASTN